MKKRSRNLFRILGWIILFLILELGFLFGKTLPWAQQTFGGVSTEEILFHLKVPLQGTDPSTIFSFLQKALLPSLIEFLPFFAVFFAFPRWERKIRNRQERKTGKQLVLVSKFQLKNGLKYKRNSKCQKSLQHATQPSQKTAYIFWKVPSWCLCIVSLAFFFVNGYKLCDQYSVIDYIKQQRSSSTFIKEQYVEPQDSLLTWPQKKRNLIYIFLESMEASYSSIENGGGFEEDLIPELTALAKENVSFSDTDGQLGGALPLPSTTWTIAGMFAQTAGLPLTLPIDSNTMGEYSTFLPNVVSLGNLLEDAGYHNCLMIGSDATFGGRRNYFEQHGNYEILDYNWAKDTGVIPENYHVFWGMEDSRLIDEVKNKLMELASGEEPFNLTMLTVDTHFPDGYRCDLCEYQHDSDYKDALSCSSRQIANLVAWIQEQDFYEDTTIVISGDHLTMAAEIEEDLSGYERHVYNCIINSAITSFSEENERNRTFSTMDMFPTTLAAMGVTIEGDRLGLGTNLFGSRTTLLEEFGYDYVMDELKKNSEFYNRHFVY